jgi:hypothetical protein
MVMTTGQGGRSEQDQKGGKLKRRLKGVRKRKKAQQCKACNVMAFKMRLVQTKGLLDR